MVIAHVLSSLRVGGGERVALELAGGQVKAGRDVMVVSLADEPDGPLAGEFRSRGVEVVTVGKRPGIELGLPLRLAKVFRARRVKVVHTHNRLPLIYGAVAGKMARAGVVHTRHGPGRGTRRETWLRRGAGHFVDAYVAVSAELATLASEVGDCPLARISVIENGIDLDRFSADPGARVATRAALGISASAYVLGSVGRLAPEKDYPLLVRAAAPLLGPDMWLVIVGDGADAATIRAAVAQAGVSQFVALPGSRSDVPQFMAAFDLFVLSSRMEGLPLVALEAMSSGLPLLATAVGGLPGLVKDTVTGFLVPSGDEGALRDRLMALRGDRAGTRAVAERGCAHVRARYSREVMVERYLDLYGRILAGRGRQ